MRTTHVIDDELRLIAALRRAAMHHGGHTPATGRIDELLDERLLSDAESATAGTPRGERRRG
jgi:hypothetical protein